MAYFEKGCPASIVRALRPRSVYRAQWFDARNGNWIDAGGGSLRSDPNGVIHLPAFPGDLDWGLKLVYEGPA